MVCSHVEPFKNCTFPIYNLVLEICGKPLFIASTDSKRAPFLGFFSLHVILIIRYGNNTH